MFASLSATAAAQPSDIASRARGAQKVVVALVADVQPRFETNEFGDRLIVSEMVLEVEETLKGPQSPVLLATVEGGTIGELALRVSDMPEMKRGDRAVFFLNPTRSGGHVPHDRGRGIVSVDAAGRTDESTLTLDDVRQAVRGSAR
jgi:hypothetical protein